MDRQTHRAIWDFPASEKGKKCLPYTPTMEWLQIYKNKLIKIKKGIGIPNIWIVYHVVSLYISLDQDF